MAHQLFELARAGRRFALRMIRWSCQPALHSLLLPETAKRDLSWDREAALPRAEMILVM